MTEEIRILVITAASIGFFHTLLGPDHYLPFIVMAKARGWSMAKTLWITLGCGVGHVASSIALGLLGVALGLGVNLLVEVESVRGNLAAWILIAFGLMYFAWGLRRAIRNRPHKHIHAHSDGMLHSHNHTHHEEHAHVHARDKGKSLTPWILFIIFVLGPCEPLIPILMYPASQHSTLGLVQVSLVFMVVTVLTMLGMVLAATWGFRFLPLGKLERYTHALAGAIIALSGLGIQFMGL